MTERVVSERRVGHRLALVGLVLALWLAQSDALLHRVVHGTAGEWQAHLSLAEQPRTERSWAVEAWGEHAKRSDCQSLDQLCTPALPVQLAPALPPREMPTLTLWPTPGWSGLFERFFSAQAPPVAF
jgi:hypothetical protein